MIFKQLPTAISDLNKLGIALKSLDAMKLGTVGVNLGNVEAYRTALKGLSVEQSVFALASKGATEEQIRQILVTDQAKLKDVEAAMAKAGLTTATKALNAEELIALATKKGISAERAKEIASALGLIATEEGQIISKKQLTVATLQQAGATDAEITAMLGLNAVETTNIGITNVLTASFTKLWAVITAHPIGAIITAIGAVAVGTIAYINKVNKDAEKALVEAHENAEKALEDTKTSLSDDKSELQSVNSELETTKEKIKEISSIGAPTLTEQNELNKLSTANAQLEAQKTLLENNIKLKQKSAALDAKELLGTQVEMEYSSILDNSSITSKKESYTYADHAKYQASNLKNAYNIYMKALEEGNVKRQELAQELIDASAGDTAELTSELLEIVESFKYDDGTIIDGYEDIYNEYMGIIYNLQSLTNPDTFLEIAKSVTTGKGIDYEKAVSEAYVLAYEGNFDIDKLNQDFVKALADAGIDDTTIEYIFKLKQQEYQSVVDSINQKYNPEKVLAPTYLEAPGHVDTPEQTQQKELDRQNYKKQKEEIQAINDSLTEYARENPIEFQLITSYDENFSTLDKYIEEEKSKVQSVKEELGSLSQNGNVDLTIRPVIDSSAMKTAGWDVEDGSIATTFTQGEFVWQGGEDDGQYVYVHYTPILPDGTVLTPDQLSNYLYGTLESSKNILEADDKGIVLKVDTDLQGVSAEDIKQLQENGIQTDGMQSFLNSMGQWDDSVHTVQESYYDMSGTVDYVDNAIKRLVEDAKKTEGIDTDETDILSTISSSISQIATQLEPQFAKLGEAYKAIFTDNGFTLDDVDNSMLEGLRKSFAEIEEEVGVAFDATKLNSFFDTLTNGNSSAEQVQQAFNDLATAYFYSTDTLAQLNEETATSIEKQLEELGVVNAHEVVTETLNEKQLELAATKEYLAEKSKDLADATGSEIAEFGAEQIEAGKCSEALALFYLKKALLNTTTITTANDCQNILDLATTANIGIVKLQQLQTLMNMITKRDAAVANGDSRAVSELNRAINDFSNNVINNLDLSDLEIDFSGIGGGTSGASKSGGDAGDTFVEAFEEELADLQDLRDRGVIDEAEYLNRLRELYTRYFADRKEYLDEYNKYERQYLEGMKSLYDSALSGISKLLSNKIDAVQEEKDITISALEEERDARLEVIEAQKEQLQAEIDLIDEQIDAKQEIIDGIQDEIDKMREANEERQRAIDLQKAQYELERMQNQRTILQYSEEKGMHYVQDTSGIRDAKQAVDDAQLEIDIAAKEKEISLIEDEIDLLEKQKDAIQDQIDALDKQSESIEKYYSKMIEQQEKMFDSMIKNLENQKSKWEELADIQEIAEAYSAIEQVFGELGYSVEDVLNGSEGAFEDFKSKYLAIMSDMNQNTSFQEGLEYASGVAKESFGSIVNDSNDVKNALSEIGSVSTELEPVATAIENIGTSSSTASANTSQIADDMSTLNTNTIGLSDNLNGISDALSNMPEASKFDAIAESFSKLAEAIGEVANTLGVGTEDTVGGLLQALTDISEISLGGEDGQGTGIISQFNNLKSAVDGVSSAISGGGGSTGASDGASTSSSPSMSAGATDGNAGGLTGAINAMKNATDEALGSGSEEDTEGEGTGAIGQFGQLKQAVDDVTTAIGSGEEGENTAEEDAANLIGAIDNLGTKTEEILVGGEDGGESGGVIGRFTEFKDVIGEANEHVTGISDGLSAIDGQEVECTIKVNIETTGGLPVGLAKSTGTALDTMNLESAEYNAKYGKAHAEGTALVSGNWAVQSNEKQALLGELGYEIIVRNGRFFTVGDNGAEMFPIKKGDIVFNHEQSEQLLKNGHISGRGKAYADGTVGNSLASGVLRPLQPGDHGYELNQFVEQLKNKMIDFGEVIPRITDIDKNVDSITKNMNSINNNNSMRQIYNTIENVNVTCPGITSDDVAKQIGSALRKEFSGMSLNAYQKMNVTR